MPFAPPFGSAKTLEGPINQVESTWMVPPKCKWN
jgi:hypothetical protein